MILILFSITYSTSYSSRLENAHHRRGPISTSIRSSSAHAFRSLRATTNDPTATIASNSIRDTAESRILDDNGLPRFGHLLAFTPDVIQAFDDAAKLIDESREIRKQAMNQIRNAFNDAKAYSLTVNQSIAQKLADIITLAVRKIQNLSLYNCILS